MSSWSVELDKTVGGLVEGQDVEVLLSLKWGLETFTYALGVLLLISSSRSLAKNNYEEGTLKLIGFLIVIQAPNLVGLLKT